MHAMQADDVSMLVRATHHGTPGAAVRLGQLLLPGVRLLLQRRMTEPVDEHAQRIIEDVLHAMRQDGIHDAQALAQTTRDALIRYTRSTPDALPGSVRPTKDRSIDLHHLPERERAALCQYYLEGHTAADVCAALHLTTTEFFRLKARARQRFGAPPLKTQNTPHPLTPTTTRCA